MFLVRDEFWQVQKTKDKGRGVFCKKKILAGTIISDYLGKVIENATYNLDLDKNGLYLMYFTDYASIYPNLDKPGPHLLNHSCQPNCWIYVYRGHTLFFTLRDIIPGEELTISYLLSPDYTCKPCLHICKCMSDKCSGTMHLSKTKYELWKRFQTKEKKKTRMKKIAFGEYLPKLAYYPKINMHDPIYKVMVT